MKARPDVALAIDGGDTAEGARALSVRGRAGIEIVDGVVPEYLAAARKSMGAEAAAEFEKNCRAMYDQIAFDNQRIPAEGTNPPRAATANGQSDRQVVLEVCRPLPLPRTSLYPGLVSRRA